MAIYIHGIVILVYPILFGFIVDGELFCAVFQRPAFRAFIFVSSWVRKGSLVSMCRTSRTVNL